MTRETIIDVGVRSDLSTAHASTMAEFARPGDWLRAEERLALVAVVRAARAEPDQPPWYRPSLVRNELGGLPDAAIDAAWRLTNHPGTLTADWYAAVVRALPSPEYYVELVGVVAAVNSIDRLADILDVAPIPLPDRDEFDLDDADPRNPAIDAAVTSHWVPTAVDAGGANVLKALTVAPATHAVRVRLSEVQYMPAAALLGDMNWSRGTIDRRQIELLAALTSKHNECFY